MRNEMAALVLLAASAPSALPAQELPLFRTEGRLVEVYAAVFDHDGRHLTGLLQDDFEVRDNGRPQAISTFESASADLSCALLLDTTGSMVLALPTLKNAVAGLIDALRPNDSVAVYGFNESVREVVEFTRDKAAAKRAVFSLRSNGRTALFDSINHLSRTLEKRPGKKALIVFTDGDDNSSLLSSRAALARARRSGLPVYTIAQGDALEQKALLDMLKDIAGLTGGLAFTVNSGSQMGKVFAAISKDLKSSYMLAYSPPREVAAWHRIEVIVKGQKQVRVRAKEGYSTD